MIHLGRILRVVEAIPREMIRDPAVSGADLRLVADRLAHAASQCRTLAECQPEPAPRPISKLRRAS